MSEGSAEKTGLKVVDFSGANFSDVQASVEQFAKDLRLGEYGNIKIGGAVLLAEDGTVSVFGWGSDADPLRLMGVLMGGIQWLSEKVAKG
jgi:hypothetical protein